MRKVLKRIGFVALLAALVVLWVGSPIASHLVAKMEIATDETAAEHIKLEEDPHGRH